MYSIKFYKDKNGREPLKEYLQELGNRTEKKTQKTPKREIEKAQSLMNEYKERGKNDENK